MSGLFGSKSPGIIQQPPEPKPPAPMPDADSPAVREARRKAQLDIMGRAGRSSTILTAPEGRGGTDYAKTTLGGSA